MVFQYMEMTTGLMVAVKEEMVKNNAADKRVQKEISYMQTLKHVSRKVRDSASYTNTKQPGLVAYIYSNPNLSTGVKKWFTAMPLYQGRLYDILPLDVSSVEDVMLQFLTPSTTCMGSGSCTKTSSPRMSWSKEDRGQMLF